MGHSHHDFILQVEKCDHSIVIVSIRMSIGKNTVFINHFTFQTFYDHFRFRERPIWLNTKNALSRYLLSLNIQFTRIC
jgi:hypothetical protein